MIRTYTSLNVADNSGAKRATCIRVLGGTRRVYLAEVGDLLQNRVHEATRLAGADHGHIYRGEGARPAGHGIGQ